jgi:hypothetical protein
VGLEFLKRVRKTSIVTALILFLVIATYWNTESGAAWLLGCAWSLVNIYFIGLLVTAITSHQAKRRLRVLLIVLVKVPVLYALGFLLLTNGWLPVIALLAGFMWPLLVITLKILGRWLLGADDPKLVKPDTELARKE